MDPRALEQAASVRHGGTAYTPVCAYVCATYLSKLATNEDAGRDPFHDWAKIVDCGDAPMTWLDNRAALSTLDKAHKSVSARPAADSSRSSTPRIITLGGDHTTTLSALRSTHARWGKVSVIHFDSHIGALETYYPR
jgi:arginase family enzyme